MLINIMKPLFVNDLNNRLYAVSLVLIIPATLLLIVALTLTYIFPNEALKQSFYAWPIFNRPLGGAVIIAAPFIAGILSGGSVLWRAYRDNSSRFLSLATVRSIARPENYPLISIALLAGVIVSFITLHDSVRCFTGASLNGWSWFVGCLRAG